MLSQLGPASVMKTLIATIVVGFFGADLRAELAFSPKGDLFGFVLGGHVIFKYAADGTKSPFAAPSERPISLTFDRAGNLFVAGFGGSIYRFSPDGQRTTLATGLKGAGYLACDAAGDLFVGDTVDLLILKFTPDKRKTTVATNVEPDRMVFDPSGNLLVPAHDDLKIWKIRPDGVKSTLASGIAYPFAPAVDPSGNLFVCGDPGTIFRIAPDGKQSAFVANFVVSIPFSTCDSRGNLFVGLPEEDSILKFTPDGQRRTFGSVQTPHEMVFDKAGNLFVQNDFAIYRFDPSGNKTTFSSDRLSPDKRWEFQCSDSGGGTGIFKAGTDQVVLDLSSDLDSRFASSAEIVWAPDSKRLAINCRSGSHFTGTYLYQLKDDKWVDLASPVDATLERLKKAKSAERNKKNRSEETSDEPDFDSWIVERWTDADHAVLQAHLRGGDYQFIYTLKFDKDGDWKIVSQNKEAAE